MNLILLSIEIYKTMGIASYHTPSIVRRNNEGKKVILYMNSGILYINRFLRGVIRHNSIFKNLIYDITY